MTGPSASTGRQLAAGAKLYLAQKGDIAGGKKIELIIKDDDGVADQTKRFAQELVVNNKVSVLAGFGLTPLALAAGPVATQAKVPAVIMVAGTAMIVDRSPYFVRTSDTLPQNTMPMAIWAAKNGIKTVVTLVSDYGPGLDSEKAFKTWFEKNGGRVVGQLHAPLLNPNFAPFLQKAKDLNRGALFLFVPSGQGAVRMKQVVDRGLTPGRSLRERRPNKLSDPKRGLILRHRHPAVYFPILIMLLLLPLVFCGVAFEFRFKRPLLRWFWDRAFCGGSALATFAQGVVLGTSSRDLRSPGASSRARRSIGSRHSRC